MIKYHLDVGERDLRRVRTSKTTIKWLFHIQDFFCAPDLRWGQRTRMLSNACRTHERYLAPQCEAKDTRPLGRAVVSLYRISVSCRGATLPIWLGSALPHVPSHRCLTLTPLLQACQRVTWPPI